jgi:hypothetical protein
MCPFSHPTAERTCIPAPRRLSADPLSVAILPATSLHCLFILPTLSALFGLSLLAALPPAERNHALSFLLATSFLPLAVNLFALSFCPICPCCLHPFLSAYPRCSISSPSWPLAPLSSTDPWHYSDFSLLQLISPRLLSLLLIRVSLQPTHHSSDFFSASPRLYAYVLHPLSSYLRSLFCSVTFLCRYFSNTLNCTNVVRATFCREMTPVIPFPHKPRIDIPYLDDAKRDMASRSIVGYVNSIHTRRQDDLDIHELPTNPSSLSSVSQACSELDHGLPNSEYRSSPYQLMNAFAQKLVGWL